GAAGLVFWETRHPSPIVNFRPLRDRNLAISCIIIFCAFGVLYGSSTLLPSLLESLFGYDAFHAGLVLSPAGVFTILAIIVVGVLLSRGFDARWLIAAGLLILGAGSFWMSQLNLDISPWQVVWPRVVMVGGLGLIFAPINVAAFLYIPRTLRGAAVGLMSLLRNEGGSVGTSMGQTITERREIFHALRLNEHRSAEPRREFLHRASPARIPAADRRPCRGAANGLAVPGELAGTASLGFVLFRRFPDFRGGRRCACVFGALDETLRRRKRRSHRSGIRLGRGTSFYFDKRA